MSISNIPSWLQILDDGVFERLIQKTQRLQLALMCCAHVEEETEKLNPEWANAVAVSCSAISSTGREVLAKELGSTGAGLLAIIEHENDPKRVAEMFVVAAIEVVVNNPNYQYWPDVSKCASILKMSPSLAALIDDEGLIAISSVVQCDRFGFTSDGMKIPFSPHLPATSSARRENDLVSLLLHERDSICLKIAPNYQKQIPISEFKQTLLEDHWFGSKYSRDELKCAHKIGQTIHTAPASYESGGNAYAACILAGIVRTEFRWTAKSGSKTFYVEEIRSSDRTNFRYLHAIYNIASQSFTHLDGAVMVYKNSDAEKRRQQIGFKEKIRVRAKPKLFRLDGTIGIDLFESIVPLFFRGNPLVKEYFEGVTRDGVEEI